MKRCRVVARPASQSSAPGTSAGHRTRGRGAAYQVPLAASGDPSDIALISEVLAPGAEAQWAADAAQASDIVVLSIPLHRFSAFDPALVAGKLVVDTMNYWPPTYGILGMFEMPRRVVARSSSAGWPAQRSSRPSTTLATTNWTSSAGRRALRTAAPSQWRATTPRPSRLWQESSTASAMTRPAREPERRTARAAGRAFVRRMATA